MRNKFAEKIDELIEEELEKEPAAFRHPGGCRIRSAEGRLCACARESLRVVDQG